MQNNLFRPPHVDLEYEEVPDWRERAACKGDDPEPYFPEQGLAIAALGRVACPDCPVKTECLQEALDDREPGIRGNTTERERRRIRKSGISAEEYFASL